MNNKQNKQICYVFSQATLDSALKEWFKLEKLANKEKQEALEITVVALEWFLKHLNHTSSIYTFSNEVLITEINHWKAIQITKYPKQKQRIEETCGLFISFFSSETVLKHKMLIEILY